MRFVIDIAMNVEKADQWDDRGYDPFEYDEAGPNPYHDIGPDGSGDHDTALMGALGDGW